MRGKLVTTRLLIFGCALAAATVLSVSGHSKPRGAPAAAQFETRCGWFSNPTPANMWLYDRDGEWTIGVQGGHQAEGDWDWPKFKRGQWVETNGHYGYGCACFQLRVDKETRRVLEVKSARGRPLSACRKDRALKKFMDKLD
jgi:hypothetical protein